MSFDLVKCSARSALPFPVRDLYDLQVSGYRDGKVILSVELPESMIVSFTSLLDSLCDSFRFLQYKSRIAKAQFNVIDPAVIEENKRKSELFKKVVLKSYDSFIASGHSQREAFKAVKKELNNKGFNLIAYNVEQIARQAGRLSKRKSKYRK